MSGQSTPLVWTFHQRGRPLPIKVRPKATVNSFKLLRELAAAGHGITRLPDYLAAQGGPQILRCILDDFAPPPMLWHVVYPSALNLSLKVRALAELLEKRLR
jgi:DNA-binding transcriptional LysR family regulator